MSLAQVQSTFETLGRSDPLWTVLTNRRFKHNRWDPRAFFATGQREIRDVLDYTGRLGLSINRGRALDFGCAVGRLTQALAEHFDEVVGVDIARSFIDEAERYNRHGARCRYLHNTRDDLALLDSASFDFIYTNITLQHSPPEHSSRYIEEFFRLVKPGGTVVFQVPAGRSAFDGTAAWLLRRFRTTFISPLKHGWRRRRGKPVIGMYGIPRPRVEQIIQTSGGRLIDVVEDSAAGKGWQSFRYCATPAAPGGAASRI